MLIYLIVLHFIADFVLQSREMGKKKSIELSWLGKHLAIQFAIFFLGLVWFTEHAFVFAGLNTIIHGIIDWYIWKGYKLSVKFRHPDAHPNSYRYWEDHWFYTTIGFDQLLHTSTIIGLWMWLCQ